MNRSLRRWHLRLVAGFSPVAAVTLVASIAVRRSTPDNPAPPSLEAPAPSTLRELDRRLVRTTGLTLELRRLEDAAAGAAFLEVIPLAAPRVADPLVYWAAGTAESLPGNAWLLGAIDGREPVRFLLPRDSTGVPGRVFLYSGATHQLLAHVDFTPRETPAR